MSGRATGSRGRFTAPAPALPLATAAQVLDEGAQLEHGGVHLALTPFDLEHGPVIRGRLVQLAADEHALLVTVGILLFIGACGKSAQIPLYVWLPDAMAGPTPVSALIHAATMVTAGVYMVTRMSGLYVAAVTQYARLIDRDPYALYYLYTWEP